MIPRPEPIRQIERRRYLDILTGAYMVRVLPPWFENLKKRQVKISTIHRWGRKLQKAEDRR